MFDQSRKEDPFKKTASFSPGEILEATDRRKEAGKHFIIFYQPFQRDRFIGGMITHSDMCENIPMQASHFIESTSSGEPYKITYDNTFLVNAKLIKLEEWGPFEVVGKLTAEGFQFIEQHISSHAAITWEQYLRHCSRKKIK